MLQFKCFYIRKINWWQVELRIDITNGIKMFTEGYFVTML
jgi:hypothetical protein